MKKYLLILSITTLNLLQGQEKRDLYKIIDEVSSERIEKDIRKLVSFGTRHTLSDTLSKKRGIGAARRWIKSEFEKISTNCNNCLEVFYQKNYFTPKDGERIVKPVWINNVVAIQKGSINPNSFIIMSGDIDSRISDPTNYKDDSPGANDNASGMAGTIEAARVLSKYKAKTVSILNKNPKPPKANVYLRSVILPFMFSSCLFHSGGICF